MDKLGWGHRTCHSLDWGIKVVESVTLDNLSTNFATNAKGWETTFDDHEPWEGVNKKNNRCAKKPTGWFFSPTF